MTSGNLTALALATALIASPALAACYEPSHLAAFLRQEHGLRLHSWGLTDEGNMQELWMRAGGHWAVVSTTPLHCADVSMPHKLNGRLTEPPRNPAMRPGPMIPGWPM